MSDSLTFLMGKYPAELPADRRYARNHMWCQEDGSLYRFGFTAYAIRLMRDVYFLDWNLSAGDAVQEKQQIGHIETSKAVSDLFAPIAGTLVAINQELLNDPSPINTDGYGAGWLFAMQGSMQTTLSVQEYYQFLDANWEKTQRTLKGHM